MIIDISKKYIIGLIIYSSLEVHSRYLGTLYKFVKFRNLYLVIRYKSVKIIKIYFQSTQCENHPSQFRITNFKQQNCVNCKFK